MGEVGGLASTSIINMNLVHAHAGTHACECMRTRAHTCTYTRAQAHTPARHTCRHAPRRHTPHITRHLPHPGAGPKKFATTQPPPNHYTDTPFISRATRHTPRSWTEVVRQHPTSTPGRRRRRRRRWRNRVTPPQAPTPTPTLPLVCVCLSVCLSVCLCVHVCVYVCA